MGKPALILSVLLLLGATRPVCADNPDRPDLKRWVRRSAPGVGTNPFAATVGAADIGTLLPAVNGRPDRVLLGAQNVLPLGSSTSRVGRQPADELGDFTPGTRLRVTLSRDTDRLSGTLASFDHQRLVLDTPDQGLVTFPLSEVSRLETSQGTRSRWKAAAIIGAVGGPAIACAVTRPCLGPGTVVFAALTGAVGALIGKQIKTERWEAVDVPVARVSLAAAPGDGVSALVSVSF